MRYQEKSMDERLYFRLIKYRMWDKGELSTSHLSNKQIKKKKKIRPGTPGRSYKLYFQSHLCRNDYFYEK